MNAASCQISWSLEESDLLASDQPYREEVWPLLRQVDQGGLGGGG